MSDAAPPVRSEPTPDGRGPAAPLTPDRIDAVLADFRGWLTNLASGGSEPSQAPPPSVDLFTLVAQFTALRHEVNLQTKAARAATEQAAEALKHLAQPPKPADPADADRPWVKTLIDVADALAIGLRQVETVIGQAMRAVGQLMPAAPDGGPPRGFWGRLFQRPDERAGERDRTRPALEKLAQQLAGVADGYALSLRRVERALTQAGVEPISAEGRPFDPELMEVVEAVAADGRPSGTVVEEVRRGYRWNGALLRFAQVKVAR